MSKKTRLFVFLIFVLCGACAPMYQVDSEGDEQDFDLTDGKCETSLSTCTLRAAIEQSNAKPGSGIPFGGMNAVIEFENVTMITPAIPLPSLTRGGLKIRGNGQVTLDGGVSPNCNSLTPGLRIYNSDYNSIQGLTVINFGVGIEVWSAEQDAAHNIIGADPVSSAAPATVRNVIGGNCQGIYMHGPGAAENIVAGNYIGTSANGSTANPNINGLVISEGAHNNLVGYGTSQGPAPPPSNVISGNSSAGISLSAATENLIAGNYIGTTLTGNIALGNEYGIYLVTGANANIIGIDGDQGATNVISANSQGIEIIQGANNNVIAGNFIGTNKMGITALGNGEGITIAGTGNLVGTNADGNNDLAESNLISANDENGIRIVSAFNTVAGNLIGTDVNGLLPSGNGENGIYLRSGANDNFIGTNGDGSGDASERNVISANGSHGIEIHEQGTDNNIVAGNYVGTDITGTKPLGNGLIGVEITSGPDGNLIGTNADGISDALEANVISANAYAGIDILGASNTQISGNLIGTDVTGSLPLGNDGYGIRITSGATGADNNWVGGTPERANVIAFNTAEGIQVSGAGPYPTNSAILFNLIFSNGDLGIDIWGEAAPAGPNPNDVGDVDGGSNSTMNFPVLDKAISANNSTAVTGEIIDGLPNTGFVIQFFYNSECDPSGYGEGQSFLGQTTKTTNASGDVSFTVNFPTGIAPGSFITSTATYSLETSEFSACVQVLTQLNQEIEQTPDLISIVPTRDINCRYYCTSQSNIADTLLEGVEYLPIGWDPTTGYLAFLGPSFGELCFAPPLAEGTQLMALNVGGQAASTDAFTADLIEIISCPLFSTPVPTLDPDEGDADEATEPSLPQCSDRVDNDNDGLVDLSDRECRDANDDNEASP